MTARASTAARAGLVYIYIHIRDVAEGDREYVKRGSEAGAGVLPLWLVLCRNGAGGFEAQHSGVCACGFGCQAHPLLSSAARTLATSHAPVIVTPCNTQTPLGYIATQARYRLQATDLTGIDRDRTPQHAGVGSSDAPAEDALRSATTHGTHGAHSTDARSVFGDRTC